MFVQVITGRVADPELYARQGDAWRTDVKPGAAGYLGSTSGVTPDGRAIVVVRFESEEAARANSDRPEQGAWWAETSKAFDGAPEFHDCTEVDLVGGGASDQAGFVQVMQGRAKDEAEARRVMNELEPELRSERPDVIGIVSAWHGDGGFTQTVYFTSEEAAREGERSMSTSEAAAALMALLDGEITFYDLPDPIHD